MPRSRRRVRLLLLIPAALVVACGASVQGEDLLIDTDASTGPDAPSSSPDSVTAPSTDSSADPHDSSAAHDASDAANAFDAHDAGPACGAGALSRCLEGDPCASDADCTSTVCSSILGKCIANPPPTASKLKSVVAGRNHTCALWDDGVVKCWGDNTYGQLGLGDTIARGKAPGEMGAALPIVATGVSAIEAGGDRTCIQRGAVTDCFGKNDLGQLGIESTLPVHAPGAGGKFPRFMGADHNCTGGAFYPTPSPMPVAALGGFECWGGNTHGQLAAGDTNARGDEPGEMASLPFMPFPVSPAFALTAFLAGYTPFPKLIAEVRQGSTASHICATWHQTDGDPKRGMLGGPSSALRIACWGQNDKGQLGLGDTNDRGDQPGELDPNTLWPDHQLYISTADPYLVGATGGAHTCAVVRFYSNSGSSGITTGKCWGDNSRGQLGIGDTNDRGDQPGEMGSALPTLPSGVASFIPRDAPRNTPYLALGDLHSCILIVRYTMYPAVRADFHCWGANDAGQLGLGDGVDRGTLPGQLPTPAVDLGTDTTVPAENAGVNRQSFAVGGNHVCALLSTTAEPRVLVGVKCWGKNDKGQLGLGDTNNRGDQPGEMGDALPLLKLR